MVKSVSYLTGRLAELGVPSRLLVPFLRFYCWLFKIDLEQFDIKLEDCKNFQQFFSRPVKKSARKIYSEIVFPVDGEVYQSGKVENGLLFQVKDKTFKLKDLFGEDEVWKRFEQAYYITLYLSPGDYHRIHAPVSAQLTNSKRIPGTLLSVGKWCTTFINNLYCIQERLILTFEDRASLVCVGALNVGSIEQTLPDGAEAKVGDEVARFLMGSTVVLLINEPVNLPELGAKVYFGQSII